MVQLTETMKLDSYVESVFITVDPERDSPLAFQKYLKGKFVQAHAKPYQCTKQHTFGDIMKMIMQ